MEAESQVLQVYLLAYSRLHDEEHVKRNRSWLFRNNMSESEESCSTINMTPYHVPIIGYEIVEQRERFTVYKIRVEKLARSWFIFRRYSDFERLNEKLICAFRTIKLKLPSKRRFGDNFNPDFIAIRAEGLQNFLKAILQHENMRICHAVREFFCLDDPPGPFDSLEESRAYVQYLEEQMENQRTVVEGLTSQQDATKSQLEQARVQIRSLECTLRTERLERNSQPCHSSPAITNDSSIGQMDVHLSDISDGGHPAPKPKQKSKSVSFAMTKAASESNLLLLKNKPVFPTLRDQMALRHSITFGDDSFLYSGFLDVEFHANVTDKMKERKRKTRKQRAAEKCETRKETDDCSPESCDLQTSHDVVLRTRKDGGKREKRDSGIIRDSFTTTGTESDTVFPW